MKFRLFAIIGVLCLGLTACQEEPYLSVNVESLSFTQDGGSQTFQVSTNGSWVASVSGSGFSVSPVGGEGDATVTVTAAATSQLHESSGSISIIGDGLSAKVALTQEAKNYIHAENKMVKVASTGGTVNVKTSYNVPYKVTVDPSASDWLKCVETKAMSDGYMVFEVAANTDPTTRSTEVVMADVAGKADPVKIVFEQEGTPYAMLDLRLFAPIAKAYDVTEIIFNVSSSVTTNKIMDRIDEADAKIYYSVTKGGALNLYTAAPCYYAVNYFSFFAQPSIDIDFSSLERLDLSNVDFSLYQRKNGYRSMFAGLKNLKTVTFGGQKIKVTGSLFSMFSNCESLESADLGGWDVTEVNDMKDLFSCCYNLKSVNLSGWDTRNVVDMSYMFRKCHALESVDLSSFNTAKVQTMSSMFFECMALKRLDLSNFDVSSLRMMDVMFNSCMALTYLDLSSFDLRPDCIAYNSMTLMGQDADKCVVKCSHKTYERIFNQTAFLKEKLEFQFTDGVDIYESSSYAMDGKVVQIQKATRGKGIDVVFMCDGFSDRMIESGDYDKYVQYCADGLFTQEPFKSYRDCFNIYKVYAVSKNENSTYETTFSVASDGMGFTGDIDKMVEYGSKPFAPGYSMDDVSICVFSNMTMGGGVSRQYYPSTPNDYGRGMGVSIISAGQDPNQAYCAHYALHELGGHGFAKLSDEYFPTSTTLPENMVTYYTTIFPSFGIAKNLDFTSDPTKVKWAKFITDPRYEAEKIGVYEGGMQYTYGVWRATANSIMNHSNGSDISSTRFNAPSREAIYYRINKLAFGEEWQYDYETFVKFDLGL